MNRMKMTKNAASVVFASVTTAALMFLITAVNADLVKMCLFYKPSGHVRSDPILSQTCVSDHVHTFYGPQQFHPQTTSDDLRNSDPKYSTSVYIENQSLYWHPSIYQVGRDVQTGAKTYTLAEISFAGPYYRWDKMAPEPKVEAFPPGFQMIAGNPVNGELLEGVHLFSECLCKTECTRKDKLCESDSDFFPSDACGEMGIAMNFPTCWNETAGLGDTNNHMDHMAYTLDGEVTGICPPGYNRRLPQIQLFVRVTNYQGGHYTFSDNTLPGDEEVFHADFMEGWLTGKLDNIVENCEATQSEGDDWNPPCACEDFLTHKDTLLVDESEDFSSEAEAGNICPINTRSYIVDEEIEFGVGGLPRGSCSATIIKKENGIDPPFVDECGLQFERPTFNEDDCENNGSGNSGDSGDSGDSGSGDGDDDDDNDEVVEDEETCTNKADKTNKFNYNGKKKSCKWVRNKIEQRCKQESLRKKCRTTCNYNGCDMTNSNSNEDNEDEVVNCTNNPDRKGRFKIKGKERKWCKWVQKNLEVRCKKTGLKKKCQTSCDYRACESNE